jgi:hypothetical protein
VSQELTNAFLGAALRLDQLGCFEKLTNQHQRCNDGSKPLIENEAQGGDLGGFDHGGEHLPTTGRNVRRVLRREAGQRRACVNHRIPLRGRGFLP